MSEKPQLYLDHNASTAIDPKVFEAMLPWLQGPGANPSSSHEPGRRARHAIDLARGQVSQAVGSHEEEVVFTSSGTEANNLAILGSLGSKSDRKHLLSCAAEHSSVLGALKQASALGFEVELLPVNSQCRVNPEQLLRAIRPDTRLLSLMLANNEIGSLQPISQIVKNLPKGVLFHCDGVQGFGKVPLNFQSLGVDFLSLSSHKIYGPSGAGALIVKKGTALSALLFGGDQEFGLRAGSEDVPAIVGMGAAAELATQRLDSYQKNFSALTRHFREKLLEKIPGVNIHSPENEILPNTLNVGFDQIEGRTLLIRLDLEGFAVSLGSACASGSLLPSHVLLAMGKSREQALSSIRFSFGYGIEKSDLDRLVDRLQILVHELSEEKRKKK